jgi:hypothetical protein
MIPDAPTPHRDPLGCAACVAERLIEAAECNLEIASHEARTANHACQDATWYDRREAEAQEIHALALVLLRANPNHACKSEA